MFGATLAGLGWPRPKVATLRAAFRPVLVPHGPFWKRWWYRLRPPAAPPQPLKPIGPPPWAGPPESEIGVAVPIARVVYRMPDLVIAIAGVTAYSNGFEFRTAVRSKTNIDFRDMGFGPPPFREGVGLSVELGYPGGRSGAGFAGRPGPEVMEYYRDSAAGEEPAIPGGPIVGQTSMSGGGKRWDCSWWAWPLPSDGPLTITCHWPARGIDTQPVELDGTAIQRAGSASTDMWNL